MARFGLGKSGIYSAVKGVSANVASGGRKGFNKMGPRAQRIVGGKPNSMGRAARKYGAIGGFGALGANALLGPRQPSSGRQGLQGRSSGGRGY